MTTKQLNIKKRSYHFYNGLINVLNFEASSLKIDKKSWKDIDIYYIGYVHKDKSSVYGSVLKENGNKFLSIDKGDAVLKKYDQVFAGIKFHIGKIDGFDVNDNTGYKKIKFLTDDSLALGKLVYFPTMTVIIRCVFKQNGIYYPQVYLDDCLCQI